MKTTLIALSMIGISSLATAVPSTPERPLGFGFVQGASAGSRVLTLDEVPAAVRHAAEVALAGYGSTYSLVGAQLDLDEVDAIYEFRGQASNGKTVEIDVDVSGKVEEIEIQINENEVPAKIMEALARLAPNYEVSKETPTYEKSLRPTRNGLLEVWYEFSGTTFDVEIRSDAKVVVIEPA